MSPVHSGLSSSTLEMAGDPDVQGTTHGGESTAPVGSAVVDGDATAISVSSVTAAFSKASVTSPPDAIAHPTVAVAEEAAALVFIIFKCKCSWT